MASGTARVAKGEAQAMAGRSFAIVGSVVAGLLVSAPAWAVSVDLDHGGGAPAPGQQDGSRPGQGAPAYSFSGNGFNLSISRTGDDDAPRAADENTLGAKTPAAHRERSLFERLRRTIEDLFGD